MQKYIIGIDTGGTFTDAILLDAATNKVIETAKVPTTHNRLAEGTGQALHAVLQNSDVSPNEIESIAVSSTLATNSVVENKGARVGLFVIGYVKHFKLPVKAVIFAKGGHTITGEEEEPLEIDYLVSLLEGLKDEVDAYGVCAAMSFKNPTHELVVEKAIAMLDPKPVFCSHRISSQTGMQQRAATAGLHAKLMPIMQDYIDGVEQGLHDHGLTCPVHIIGGNGKSIGTQVAINHAGMTVASGPACTAFFGAQHAENDALIIDIGGTTTDIAMIKERTPLLAEQGCRIGDWQTHVEAIDMFTRGIGGDSHVRLNDQKSLTIGPQRVVPISLSTASINVSKWLGTSDYSKCITAVTAGENIPASGHILQILLEKGPLTPAKLRTITGLSGIPLEKELEHLSRKQLIEEMGFTPTDALHVLGETTIGDCRKAQEAAKILGNLCNMDADAFAMMVVDKTTDMIENCIIEYVIDHLWQEPLTHIIAERNNHPILGIDFLLKIPMIGVGAAAPFFLPRVARKLKTTVQFPKNYEVGNALGAALICRAEKKNKSSAGVCRP